MDIGVLTGYTGYQCLLLVHALYATCGNLYCYGGNNPVRYVDPDGRIIDTIWDIACTAYDIGSAIHKSSKGDNSGWVDVAIDAAAILIPGVPAGLSKIDDAVKLAKAADKIVDTAKAADKVADAARAVDKVNDTVKTVSKPNQIHHFLSNKSSKFTKQFETITNKYGLKLDGAWNKASMPHQGRHTNKYHEFMIDKIQEFDEIAGGDKDVFLQLFDSLKDEIIKNPDMLYRGGL